MGADEADIHHPVCVVDPDHKAVFVAGQIKHRAPIPKDAGGAEIPLDV
jgi:hypothetical protein